jgi:hypothetical protein
MVEEEYTTIVIVSLLSSKMLFKRLGMSAAEIETLRTALASVSPAATVGQPSSAMPAHPHPQRSGTSGAGADSTSVTYHLPPSVDKPKTRVDEPLPKAGERTTTGHLDESQLEYGDVLGVGGFGEVRRAIICSDGNLAVAVKRLTRNHASTDKDRTKTQAGVKKVQSLFVSACSAFRLRLTHLRLKSAS